MRSKKLVPTGVVIVVVAISFFFLMGFRLLDERGFVVRIAVCR